MTTPDAAQMEADLSKPAGGYTRAGGQTNVLPTKGSQGKLGGMDTSRTDDVNTDKTDGPT